MTSAESSRVEGVISFGAGVQTTALAILNARGEVARPARDLVFADTGGEKPETMEYLQVHFLPWAEGHGLRLHTVTAPSTLYDYAMRRKMVPSIFTRWSTSEAKIRPIKRWLRAQGATAQQPADVQVVISADESHRAVDGWAVKYARKRWPLCEIAHHPCRMPRDHRLGGTAPAGQKRVLVLSIPVPE